MKYCHTTKSVFNPHTKKKRKDNYQIDEQRIPESHCQRIGHKIFNDFNRRPENESVHQMLKNEQVRYDLVKDMAKQKKKNKCKKNEKNFLINIKKEKKRASKEREVM